MRATLKFVVFGLFVSFLAIALHSGGVQAQDAAAGSFGAAPSDMAPWATPQILTAFSLIAVGLLLMLAEALTPGFGVLGLLGTIAFVCGGLILAGSDLDGAQSVLPFIVGLGVVSIGLIVLTVVIAKRIRARPVVSGQEDMLGQEGLVISVDGNTVYAHVLGEKWRVRSDTPLSLGQAIRVQGVKGLTLHVVPVQEAVDANHPT